MSELVKWEGAQATGDRLVVTGRLVDLPRADKANYWDLSPYINMHVTVEANGQEREMVIVSVDTSYGWVAEDADSVHRRTWVAPLQQGEQG